MGPRLNLSRLKALPEATRTAYTIGVLSLIVSILAIVMAWTNRGTATAPAAGA